jgi:CheY-like chemotaxis protein
LITDDDRDFRETLQSVFAPRGFDTFLAGDGEEALDIVHNHNIHLVLMDLHMPKLTGLETICRIKLIRQELPCILISGELDDAIREQATQAFEVLSKPVSFHEITTTVVSALRMTYEWGIDL